MRSLIDPLWLLIAVLAVAVFAKFNNPRINHAVKLVGRVSIALLVFLSTGVATLIFDKILANTAQDFLGTESIRRVNAASALWLKYPDASVVFSGGQPGTENDRAATRHGELSSEHAISLRLAESRIIIESGSLNTRQHPIEALKLSGVSQDSKIAIVTSDFHLRRALGEFNKHFDRVEAVGTGDAASGLSWLNFVPLATHLDENVYRIKEFAGIAISKVFSSEVGE